MGKTKPLVVYDSRCLFCISCKNKIERLDKEKKLDWVGIDKFDYKTYKLKKEDLLKEIHLISNGKIYRGFYAWKRIAKNIPLLLPLYVFSLIPGIGLIAGRIYKIIAKRRHNL